VAGMNSLNNLKSGRRYREVVPVILAVPGESRPLRGKEKVFFLSTYARRALAISAEKSGIPLGRLSKDESGAPLPFDGNHWSLSHKPDYVAGVVARNRIGIDIEKIKPCSESLFDRIASKAEWELIRGDRLKSFYRYWTSKEAVLKAEGIGIKGLSNCCISRIISNTRLVVSYLDREWTLEHTFFDDHIASIVTDKDPVNWVLLKSDDSIE